MLTSRHDRARDQVLEDHRHRLYAVDGVLALVADEQRAPAPSTTTPSARPPRLACRSDRSAVRSDSPRRASAPRSPAPPPSTTRSAPPTRRRGSPDPHIQSAIGAALEGARTVVTVNVGAGTGSYEPPETLLAVEPSMVMVAQRPPGLAPAAATTADRIPLPDHSSAAALCSLTIHHWPDLEAGLAEVRRVARRAVIFTWDQSVARDFWLIRGYFPEYAAADDHRAIPIDRLCDLLGTTDVRTVPVPRDCTDGFLGAFWARPEAYLDPIIRTRTWHRRHAALLKRTELDLGYRLIVADWF